jgi:VanZ family protein
MIDKLLNADKKTKMLIAATLLWMGVIFWFSSQPADESARLSGSLTSVLEWIAVRVFGWFSADLMESLQQHLHFLVRKTAHVMEYMVLGGLAGASIKRLKVRKSFIVCVVFCMLYAASDEFHQMFVPGRGPLLSDVAVDTAAAAVGAVITRVRVIKGYP